MNSDEVVDRCIEVVCRYLIDTEGYTTEEIQFHDLQEQLQELKLDLARENKCS